jgi:hypothetical protein
MVIYQAIVTQYFGPSNVRGSRVKARASAGSVTLHWDCSLNYDANHARAAQALANKFKWQGAWFGGGMPNGKGNVYVCVPGRTDCTLGFTAAFTTEGEG